MYKDDIEKIRYYSYLNIDSLFHYSRKLEKSENQCVSNTGKNNISSAYYKSGNFKKSEEVALSVLSNIKELNSTCNIDNKLHALSRMFWIKNNQRKFDEAFDYLNQKTQLLSNYSEKNKKYIRTIIFNETSLAILKNNLGFHKEAINILKKVIEKYTLLDDEYGNVYDYNLVVNKASSYNALGESFFALNANSNNDKYLDSTLFYYKKAFEETEKFIPKHENSLSFYHLRVATVLIKRKQYKRALSLVNTFELANKSQDYYFLKSLIYKNLKRSDSSLFYSYKFLNFNKTSPNA